MRIRRACTAVALGLLVAAPLSAQMTGMNHDPDKSAGGGTLPAGWMQRKDRESAPDAKVVTMGTGLHVTSGAAAIYWTEKDKVTVPFTASASFTQTRAPSHPEGYGLFFMGSKLASPEQGYAYLLVRGDGKFLVKHRAGNDVHTVKDWTESSAVHKADAEGKATNVLGISASADSTRLMVNGVQVAAFGPGYGKADGYVGLRVNHNLDVHVDAFTVKETKPAKPARPATSAKRSK